jgi:hypothetical protein
MWYVARELFFLAFLWTVVGIQWQLSKWIFGVRWTSRWNRAYCYFFIGYSTLLTGTIIFDTIHHFFF